MDKNPILQVKNITKLFPGVRALTDVSIDFYPGEVQALVGENGAGKSTLVKIISGVYIPTEGTIIYDSQTRDFKTPKQALDCGISVIHQELSIANDLTVAENIFLGSEPRLNGKNGFLLDRKKMNQQAQAVLDQMKVSIKATDIAGTLTAAHQQMIEIAKVITKQSKFVIMDEPTSSLSESEIDALFEQIKILKEKRISIIYITHRLKELSMICDRVTVLRDGQLVKTMKMNETTEAEIVSSMVGRTISDYYNKKEHQRKEEMLRVEGLTISGVFKDISFTAYKGEILGIAGLVGAKRTNVLESIFGATRLDAGRVLIEEQEVHFKSPRDAIEHKIGFVTEDRRSTGLMLQAKLRDNVVLPSLTRMRRRFGRLNPKWEKEVTTEYAKKLRIKTPSILTNVSNLSGGNQQKVILAKWLIAQSKILLLDEPTRGIDVNAKAEFYALMNTFVEEGRCIVMVSSELPEILGVSDRVIVMREGRISGELSREEASEQSIIQLASIHSGS
ncbi:sugar ABC transporter ATP-binding protein [Oscillospiraceae bacterium PP1C4]